MREGRAALAAVLLAALFLGAFYASFRYFSAPPASSSGDTEAARPVPSRSGDAGRSLRPAGVPPPPSTAAPPPPPVAAPPPAAAGETGGGSGAPPGTAVRVPGTPPGGGDPSPEAREQMRRRDEIPREPPAFESRENGETLRGPGERRRRILENRERRMRGGRPRGGAGGSDSSEP